MTTFNDVKKLEGKNVLMLTENGSIYIGAISNVQNPKHSHHVAFVNFKYGRWFKAATVHGSMYFYAEGNTEEFPIWQTDELKELERINLLRNILLLLVDEQNYHRYPDSD